MSGKEVIEAGVRKGVGYALLFVLASGGSISLAACVSEELIAVKRGMSESEATRLLGRPSYEIDKEEEFSTYIEKDCDASGLRKILVYDRFLWPDIAVALNDELKVECVNVAVFMRFD